MSRRRRQAAVVATPASRTRFRQVPLVAAIVAGIAIGTLAFGYSRGWFSSHALAERLGPPSVNAGVPEGAAPAGMVWIPGGTFWMGCEDFQDAPLHKIYVDGFWLDRTEVTNAQFRSFVEETGHITVAEKPPDLDDLAKLVPDQQLPAKEDLVPGSLVFSPPKEKVPLTDISQWWKWTRGACWRHPEGPGSDFKGRDDHPVVHVAYRDALAYCAWRSEKEGGVFRLPTEAEWEFAARGGLDRNTYVWGNQSSPRAKTMANTWQGDFPHHNRADDGYPALAPVASFPANGFGLYDMAGNVWEWCADWYRPDYYPQSGPRNPRGPESSHDPLEPGIPKRVQRGGSFLCCDQYCKRYVPGARGKGEPDSSTNHIGFRCVREK